MEKIEHIGIAVKDMEASLETFSKLFNKQNYKIEKVLSEGIDVSLFEIGDSKIELLSATREDSHIAKFIEINGEGIHHLAFEVENLDLEIVRLKSEGFKVIDDLPKVGVDNKRIVFLHPKSVNGVLIELCENIK